MGNFCRTAPTINTSVWEVMRFLWLFRHYCGDVAKWVGYIRRARTVPVGKQRAIMIGFRIDKREMRHWLLSYQRKRRQSKYFINIENRFWKNEGF